MLFLREEKNFSPYKEVFFRAVVVSMSNEVKELDVRRLQQALEASPHLRNSNAFTAEFKEWHRMINYSLNQLFGPKHKYSHDLLSLRFWEFRISFGRRKWRSQDQERYEHDLTQAASILNDALKEMEKPSD